MTHLDWSDLVTERAAIMQHDGGMSETLARKRAWDDTVERFGPPPNCPEPPVVRRNRANFRPNGAAGRPSYVETTGRGK